MTKYCPNKSPASLAIQPLYWGQLFYHSFGKTFGSLLVSDFASLYRAPESFMVNRRGEPDIQHELLSSYVQVVSTYMRYLSYFINCYYQGRVKSSHQGKIASVCWKKEGQGHFNFWSRCLQNRVGFHSLSLGNSLLKLIQVWKRFYGHLTYCYLGAWPHLYFYSIIWWMIQDISSTVHGLWVSGFADNGSIEIL